MVKEAWFQRDVPGVLPAQFNEIIQSWDTRVRLEKRISF